MIRSIKAYAVINVEKPRINALEIYGSRDDLVVHFPEMIVPVEIRVLEEGQSAVPERKSGTSGMKKIPLRSRR